MVSVYNGDSFFGLGREYNFKTSYLYIEDEENRAYEFDDRIAYFNPVLDRKSGGIEYVRDFFSIK